MAMWELLQDSLIPDESLDLPPRRLMRLFRGRPGARPVAVS